MSLKKKVIEYVVRAKDESSGPIGNIAKLFDGLSTKAKLLTTAAAAAVIALVRMAVDASKALMETTRQAAAFNAKVAEVNTLLQAPREKVRQLSNSLKDLSVKFGQSMETMATAEYNVVSAGFSDISESLFLLDVASRAAIAGVSDVNTAARALTQVINAYGMESADAEKIAGTLFATVKGGVTTFNELASYLGQVTSTAAAAGISFEEVSAAIAAMTKKGIETPLAVTALNSLLLGLAAASGESKQMLDELGITLKDGLGPALEAMYEAGGDNLEVLKQMVPNMRALRAATSLGAEGAKEFKSQLDNMSGGVQDFNNAYKIMSQTLQAAIDRLKTAEERYKQTVGEIGGEAAISGINQRRESLEQLTETVRKHGDGIKYWSEQIETLSANWETFKNSVKWAGVILGDFLAKLDYTDEIREFGEELTRASEKVDQSTTHLVLFNLEADVADEKLRRIYEGLKKIRGGDKGGKDEGDKAKEDFAALVQMAQEFGIAIETPVAQADGSIKMVAKSAQQLRDELTAIYEELETKQPTERQVIPVDPISKEAVESAEDIADILMDIKTDPWPDEETLGAMQEYIEKQKIMKDLANDIRSNMQQVLSQSITTFLTAKNEAIMFGRAIKEAVIKALSVAIAKLVMLRALSIFNAIIPGGGGGIDGSLLYAAAGGTIPKAASGYSVPDGPRGVDSRLIMAMPGEEVINRSLSMRLERFITAQEMGAAVSPSAFAGGGGGGNNIVLNIGRPVGRLDLDQLADDLNEAAVRYERSRLL